MKSAKSHTGKNTERTFQTVSFYPASAAIIRPPTAGKRNDLNNGPAGPAGLGKLAKQLTVRLDFFEINASLQKKQSDRKK